MAGMGKLDVIDDLRASGVEAAPHVAARLRERLNDDPATVREVVAALTPAQRAGWRALPDPLPVVPAIERAFGDLELSFSQRDALLLASLIRDRRLDAVVAASGLSADELLTGALAAQLRVSAGRLSLRDRRLGVWMRGTASPALQASAHDRLARFYAGEQDSVRAAWHSARGAVVRRPEVAPILLAEAARLIRAGQAHSAYRTAVEAFHHAEDDVADHARRIAGVAALSAGLVEDAVHWMRSIARPGSTCHTQALAALIVAETHVLGTVPVHDPAELRPRNAEPSAWRAWARAAAAAATAAAERGGTATARAWLAELREADSNAGAGGAIRDPAVDLCWLLGGEDETVGAAPFTSTGGIVAALRCGLRDDPDAGLRILAQLDAGLADSADPALGGIQRSPLVSAYRAVTEVLLRVWRGDVRTAYDRLVAASSRYPISLPFAGLGVQLGRHLDLAIHGSPGALSRSLAFALPSGDRLDAHVDSAVEAYLAGSIETANVHLQLWHDRGAPRLPLAPPGLDEVGPLDVPVVVEPLEASRTRSLLHRIRATAQGVWQREYPDLVEQARHVQSPFTRGRVEALLGATCAIHGDPAAGRRHLRMARALFSDIGAHAWRGAVDARLARLGEQLDLSAQPATMPVAVTAPDPLDPLAACRAAWAPVLRDRELQVAMLIVEGAANREIARRLNLSVRTVEVHAGRAFAKLSVRGRVELTVLAHRTNQHI